MGYYELYLNGNKVGKNKLDPGLTHSAKRFLSRSSALHISTRTDNLAALRVLYVTYDVTQLLNMDGTNAFGVMLGGGWYRMVEGGEPALYFELRVNSASGQQTVVVSDSSWTVAQGPIISDSVYNGEVYDARVEQPGWSNPSFSENWANATILTGPQGQLKSQMIPPIQYDRTALTLNASESEAAHHRVMQVLDPVTRTTPVTDTVIFDFNQTIRYFLFLQPSFVITQRSRSGWCKLRVTGPRGTTVTLRYAEVLSQDGSGMPYFENLRSGTDLHVPLWLLENDCCLQRRQLISTFSRATQAGKFMSLGKQPESDLSPAETS